MKTIKAVFDEFLDEQQARLKPRTYRDYEYAINLFEDCLDGYAYSSLSSDDSERFDELSGDGKEFCEIFGPDKISSSEIDEFLDYFMVKKVIASKTFMKLTGTVMRKFVKWMNEKGYMNEEDYEDAAGVVDDLKDGLVKVAELSDLIGDYIRGSPRPDVTEDKEGYFTVVKIEPGKLWLDNYTENEPNVGPVIVSEEISSKCEEGWTICLLLGKAGEVWHMLESGFVYQR